MRLVTRSDFDGLVCGVLLKAAGIVDDFAFVHPKDLQDGLVSVTKKDVLANVAYAEGCGMWFDHHTSELERVGSDIKVEGLVRPAPSCARVIWEYFGGHARFSSHFDSLLNAVDKVDSGMISFDEVNDPKGWILLGFLMDPRTGLNSYTDYRINGYQLMIQLMDACAEMTADEVLALPDVKERVDRYFAQDKLFREMLQQSARCHGNVLVVDLREQEEVYTGNRFTMYALYPECNVSITAMWGFKKKRVVLAVGHSILNRTCTADIGSLMLKYGGGGHLRVGTCQVMPENADATMAELIRTLGDKI